MQRKAILANISRVIMSKAYKTKAGMTQADKIAYLNAMVDWAEYDDTMRRALQPILFALINETGKSAIAEVGLDPSQFNPTALNVLNYNQERASKIATDVNDETEKQLRASISEGLDDGEGLDELAARVEDVMGSAATFRADRIAKTERVRAQGFADIEAWGQSGVVEAKEWYCTLSERSCVFCRRLDGTIIGLEDDFYAKGDRIEAGGKVMKVSYDNVPSCPLHLNCECSLIAVMVPTYNFGE